LSCDGSLQDKETEEDVISDKAGVAGAEGVEGRVTNDVGREGPLRPAPFRA
jgi:hypothetical protein